MSLVDLVRLTLISCGISETVEKTAAIKPIIAMYSILNQTLRLCHHHIFRFSYRTQLNLENAKTHQYHKRLM